MALDADGDMIAEGRRLADLKGRDNIIWRHARAEALTAEFGRFRLTTIGQSFQWMDRDLVQRRLAELTEAAVVWRW